LIRSAVSDAAANLLSFIPSLGTREVFAFGSGVALPTRLSFKELPLNQRPNSEAGGSTQAPAGSGLDRDLIGSVIERWRSSTMSHRSGMDDDEFGAAFSEPATSPVAPSPPVQPAQAYPTPQRSSLLKKPLEPGLGSASQPPGYPPRFR
jgi:hypothetical protein